MLRLLINSSVSSKLNTRCCATVTENAKKHSHIKFETVFSFPSIKYISILNRLKVYQIFGTSLAIPGCGLLEILEVLPHQSVLSASYIGFTGAALFTLASLPFRNTIGFLYISEDNKQIKISSMDFWGRRKDKLVSAEEWIPLFDISPKSTDMFYLTPQLTDGTKYKLFVKFGNVLNSTKIGQVLE